MSNAQRRATDAYRARLAETGLARFEVKGRSTDRELIRRLARRLAEHDREAAELRILLGERLAKGRTGADLYEALASAPRELGGMDLTGYRREAADRELDLG